MIRMMTVRMGYLCGATCLGQGALSSSTCPQVSAQDLTDVMSCLSMPKSMLDCSAACMAPACLTFSTSPLNASRWQATLLFVSGDDEDGGGPAPAGVAPTRPMRGSADNVHLGFTDSEGEHACLLSDCPATCEELDCSLSSKQSDSCSGVYSPR